MFRIEVVTYPTLCLKVKVLDGQTNSWRSLLQTCDVLLELPLTVHITHVAPSFRLEGLATFRAEPLNPIFRPRAPKPHFPTRGPSNQVGDEFECICGSFGIEFPC